MDPDAIFEHHPKFYIPSGDVILAVKLVPPPEDAETPPRYRLFRVHKFLLGLRSTFFSNLFTDGDVAASNDASYDGVPLIELHEDNAEDFALLLGYLYDPETSLNFRQCNPDTPIAVGGVIRLADKYLLEPLRKRLVGQVVQDWPTTLRDWDIHHAEMEAVRIACLRTMPRDDPDRGPSLPASIPEPASAIIFAQEFRCREILPAAFYQLIQIDVQLDWRFRGPDVGGPHSGPFRGMALARWHLLDEANFKRYFKGQHAAEHYIPSTAVFMSEDCIPTFREGWESDPKSSCFLYIRNMLQVMRKKGNGRTTDPLRWLSDCSFHTRFPELLEKYVKRMCPKCRMVIMERVPRERLRVWRELLPKWFELE